MSSDASSRDGPAGDGPAVPPSSSLSDDGAARNVRSDSVGICRAADSDAMDDAAASKDIPTDDDVNRLRIRGEGGFRVPQLEKALFGFGAWKVDPRNDADAMTPGDSGDGLRGLASSLRDGAIGASARGRSLLESARSAAKPAGADDDDAGPPRLP
ncbi:hypothetical protein THAOC_12755, partial [Thalassiosira oceanica]